MLQLTEGKVVEQLCNMNMNMTVPYDNSYFPQQGYYHYTNWYSYPVYICTDKTKKAIEILKYLQEQKLLECKSVNKFIELVDKISSIL